MERNISTNIHLPESIYKAAKMMALEKRISLKQVFIEALQVLMKRAASQAKEKKNRSKSGLFKYAGVIETGITNGSLKHDQYIYDDDLP